MRPVTHDSKNNQQKVSTRTYQEQANGMQQYEEKSLLKAGTHLGAEMKTESNR